MQEETARSQQPWLASVQKKLDAIGGWKIAFDAEQQQQPRVEAVIPLPRSTFGVKVLDDVCPQAWCDNFIAAHETVGFTPQSEIDLLTWSGRANAQYRAQQGYKERGKNTSESVTIHDLDLAHALWRRVQPHLPEMLTDSSPALALTEALPGTFRAVGVIPTFRFMRYKAGQAFKLHKDPSRVLTANPLIVCEGEGEGAMEAERGGGVFKSFFTLAIYLNDQSDFEGGALTFVKQVVVPGGGVLPTTTHNEPLASVAPKVGRCAIFRHEELHEGGEVFGTGAKHMMQCDVLYEWVGPIESSTGAGSLPMINF